MFKIIVDSTADLPEEYLEMYDITVVPLIVRLNDTEYKDNVTIDIHKLYDALRNGITPKTSLPNPGDIHNAVYEAAKSGKDVLFLTISAKLSGTHQCVKMICDDISTEFPNVKIEVIDCRGGSAISGIMALQAARLREEKLSLEEITEVMKDMANHCEHIFTVDNLKYLISSGRINKTEAFIGNLLNIKPILTVDDGEIKLYKKVHGRNKSLTTIVDMVVERIKGFPNQILGIMHADSLDVAQELKKMITDRIGETKVIMGIIGSVIGSHIGIGGVGVFFFNKRPKYYIL